MAICKSCGGVIGADCFNPEECAWITEQEEKRAREQQQGCNVGCPVLSDERAKQVLDQLRKIIMDDYIRVKSIDKSDATYKGYIRSIYLLEELKRELFD